MFPENIMHDFIHSLTNGGLSYIHVMNLSLNPNRLLMLEFIPII